MHQPERRQLCPEHNNGKPQKHRSPILKFHIILASVERSAEAVDHVETAGGDRLAVDVAVQIGRQGVGAGIT